MTANFGRNQLPMGNIPLDQQNFNLWVWSTIQELAFIPATPISNFRVTPQPGGNLIDFTRSDGDSYTLYINSAPSINLATLVQLGTSNRYTHAVGSAGIQLWYTVQTNKGNLIGPFSSWLSGITLGLAVPAAVVEPPPATNFPFVDQETDAVAATVPAGGSYVPL